MTKIESRNAVEVDELPPWDETDADEQASQEQSELAPYSYDSEQRTLVGIGPLGRARRSRPVAAAPVSDRMPLSEPPGPFIADDEIELAAPRGRRAGKRAVAVAVALLVPLAVLGLVRRLSSSEPETSEAPRSAAANAVRQTRPAPLPEATPVATPASEPREVPVPQAVSAREDANANDLSSSERSKEERPRPGPSADRAKGETAPPAVKLAELPAAPAVVDRSNGDVNAGSINVVSTPPANVVLDGRPLGKSPRVVRASAGLHTLVFIHPLYGRRSVTVTVRSGATTPAAAEF